MFAKAQARDACHMLWVQAGKVRWLERDQQAMLSQAQRRNRLKGGLLLWPGQLSTPWAQNSGQGDQWLRRSAEIPEEVDAEASVTPGYSGPGDSQQAPGTRLATLFPCQLRQL